NIKGQEGNSESRLNKPDVDSVRLSTFTNTPVLVKLEAAGQNNAGTVSYSVVQNPSHGRVGDLQIKDNNDVGLNYFPIENYAGNDNFKVEIVETSSGARTI